MDKKSMILTIVLSIILVLLITIGASYAYFTANISDGEESTTIEVKGGKMLITYDGGDDIDISNIFPKDTPFATKTFTVAGYNNTNVDMGYKISLVVESNTFSNEALKYKLISTNTDNNGIIVPSITELKDILTGKSTITLGYGNFEVPTDGNKTHTYELELYFPNQDYNQNDDQEKQIKAYVTVENFDYSVFLSYDETKGVNIPVLFTGMTPVKWDETFNEIETDEDDEFWYDYDNQKWANAKSADGSYWVWIPRYAYKITSGYHSNETGTIDIKFLQATTNIDKSGTSIETTNYNPGIKDTSMYHFLHPAFEIEGAELGFWIAKYEPTAAESVATITGTCVAGDDVSTKTVKIIPNATSWRCITIGNAFDAILSMKTNPVYGWGAEEVDPHLLTNLEWGAVTYLYKSGYGADTEEIWSNAFKEYRTGCSGTFFNAKLQATCVAYNTTNGVKASTTHNIYGVYDMSGGANEAVSAYVSNGNSNLATYGQSILNASNKYKNIYNQGASDTRPLNYEENKNIYGDAVYETSSTGANFTSWYGLGSDMPYASYPWFGRGNTVLSIPVGPFRFERSMGNASVVQSFRPAVRRAS